MRRKQPLWSNIIMILLVVSLVVNVIFAVLYVRLSGSVNEAVEQLEQRTEEFTALMQERQDSVNYEAQAGLIEDPDQEGSISSDKTETENLQTVNDGNDRQEQIGKNETEKKASDGTKDSTEDGTENSKKNNTDKGVNSDSGDSSEQDSDGKNGKETGKEMETETETETGQEVLIEAMDGPIQDIYDQYLESREALGELWAVSVESLEDGKVYGYNSREKMQSASVIKVFIMGTVYDRMCYPSSADRLIPAEESYDGELRYLLEQMITISDNDAANQLITKLGQGDFQTGAQVVNEFCEENGYTSTSVGRRFLEENPTGDNYTSAADCRKILSDIYNGTCVEEEASEKMLEILKQQTNTVKIPAGLPQGTSTANKTGEMPEGYGLGCIENDMAIIFTEDGDYVLTVLSNELAGRNDEARQVITGISSLVYEWFQEESV